MLDDAPSYQTGAGSSSRGAAALAARAASDRQARLEELQARAALAASSGLGSVGIVQRQMKQERMAQMLRDAGDIVGEVQRMVAACAVAVGMISRIWQRPRNRANTPTPVRSVRFTYFSWRSLSRISKPCLQDPRHGRQRYSFDAHTSCRPHCASSDATPLEQS